MHALCVWSQQVGCQVEWLGHHIGAQKKWVRRWYGENFGEFKTTKKFTKAAHAYTHAPQLQHQQHEHEQQSYEWYAVLYRTYMCCAVLCVVLFTGNEASNTMFYTAASIVGVVPAVGDKQRSQAARKASKVCMGDKW